MARAGAREGPSVIVALRLLSFIELGIISNSLQVGQGFLNCFFMKKKAPAYTAVIFDIDNVLVNTKHSYLDAIRWTVEIFLTGGNIPYFQKKGKESTPEILTARDVEEFKLLGGFNDDWDTCYGLLIYLLNLPVKGRTVAHLKKAMNLSAFSKSIKTKPLGVNGIVKKFGQVRDVRIEKISRIFQEVYLGKEIFELVEKKRASYWKKRGLIHKEKFVIRRPTLQRLKNSGVALGIATGRSRFEAVFALKHFKVFDLFDVVTTMDEIKKAERTLKKSLRKPNPFSVVETAKKIGLKNKFLYVGDLPDDILAANGAKSKVNIKAVGFPLFANSPKRAIKELEKAGADYVLKQPAKIADLALTGKIR